MQIFASKLITLVYALFIVTLGLTGWGLAQSSSAKKEIDKENAALEQQLKSSPQSLNFSGDQASSASPSTPATSSTPAKSGASSSSSSGSAVTVSDEAKQTASLDVLEIRGYVEAYWADNGYYPGDISYSTLSSIGGDLNKSAFTPPTGLHYVYTPSPSGCGSNNTCMHYSIAMYDSAGNAITSLLKDNN